MFCEDSNVYSIEKCVLMIKPRYSKTVFGTEGVIENHIFWFDLS